MQHSTHIPSFHLQKMLKILERLPCWCFPVHTLVKVRSQSCLHVNNVPCTEYDTDHSHFTSTFCRLSGNLKTLHTAVFVNYAQTPYSLSYCSRSLVRCQAGIRDFPLPQNVTKGSAPPPHLIHQFLFSEYRRPVFLELKRPERAAANFPLFIAVIQYRQNITFTATIVSMSCNRDEFMLVHLHKIYH